MSSASYFPTLYGNGQPYARARGADILKEDFLAMLEDGYEIPVEEAGSLAEGAPVQTDHQIFEAYPSWRAEDYAGLAAPAVGPILSRYCEEHRALTKCTWLRLTEELSDAEWEALWERNASRDSVAHAIRVWKARRAEKA